MFMHTAEKDPYTSAMDAIKYDICEAGITKPSDILSHLLQDYIKKSKELNHAHSYVVGNQESDNVVLAKKLLTLLKPQENKTYLKLLRLYKPYTKEDDGACPFFSETRKSQDPVVFFIKHLNVRCQKLNLPNNIKQLLSAFFYVYKQYQILLSDDLIKSLSFKNDWNEKISQWINDIVAEMSKTLNSGIMLASCEALSQLATYTTIEARQSIAVALLPYVDFYDHKVKAAVFPILVALREWVPAEKRKNVISGLIDNIKNENTMAAVIAIESLYELREWITVIPSFANIEEILTQEVFQPIIDKLLSDFRGGKFEAKLQVLDALRRLKHSIPVDLYPTMMNALIKFLDKTHPRLYLEVCDTIFYLHDLLSQDQYNLLVDEFSPLIKDKKMSSDLRVAAIKMMYQLKPPMQLSHGLIDLTELEKIIENENENANVRVAVCEAWVHVKQPDALDKKIVSAIVSCLNNEHFTLFDMAVNALTCMKKDFCLSLENPIHDKTHEMLASLRPVLSFDARISIINNLLDRVRKEKEKIDIKAYSLLTSYIDDMDNTQKAAILFQILSFSRDEKNCHHFSKILFARICHSYEQEMAAANLQATYCDESRIYLPNEVTTRILRFIS